MKLRDAKLWFSGARALLCLVGGINLARGLSHLLAQDSAAGQAGIALAGPGAADIIYLFAVIGAVQALLALFDLYSALIAPQHAGAALCLEVAKTALTLWIGFFFKPSTAAVVVGSRQDALQLLLALAALALLIAHNASARRSPARPVQLTD